MTQSDQRQDLPGVELASDVSTSSLGRPYRFIAESRPMQRSYSADGSRIRYCRRSVSATAFRVGGEPALGLPRSRLSRATACPVRYNRNLECATDAGGSDGRTNLRCVNIVR